MSESEEAERTAPPQRRLRRTLAVLHRYFGLATAVFLFVAGATGAVISWDHELDEWLNPALFHAHTRGRAKPALELVALAEAADPRMRVTYAPLTTEPGHTLVLTVAPRIDPRTNAPYTLGYNQVALDPVSGAIVGKRMWGQVSLSRENLLPFLYKLHYSMHIPDGFGVEVGVLFMGIVGIAWLIDCFIALYISFPSRKVWRKSFAFRFRKGGQALNFDLHRSGGVWAWMLLLVVAFTSVSMNLGYQVVRPMLSLVTTLTPDPFAMRTERPENRPIEPTVTRERAIALGLERARMLGVREPAGAIFYAPGYGLYGVGFFAPGNDHGDGGLGNPWVYVDGTTGAQAGDHLPGTGTAGDVFLQAQFPLHSGRIFGLAGRIVISLLGAVVAMLSVTGVIIWAKRRGARARAAG